VTVVLAVVAGGIGAWVRAEVTARLGVRRGTATVNLAGAFLLGLLVGLAGGADSDTGTLVVLGTGAMGGLTTFSTWMLDTMDRPDDDEVPALLVTLFAGMVLAGVGWFVGALVT
jgi:CrcB protein